MSHGINLKNCIFSDVPPDVITFTITVMNRGRRAKDAEVAEVTVDMQSLKSGNETEEWYPLTGVTPIGKAIFWAFSIYRPMDPIKVSIMP